MESAATETSKPAVAELAMKLQFLGATGTVTGSKYLLTRGDHRVLVDCGLFQGFKQLRLRNWEPPPFDPTALDATILTHAHLDHSGYLPLIVKRGFKGPVYCTEATYDLCRILLPDSGRLLEEEAENANRHGWSKHKPALPLYTEADAVQALERFEPQPFETPFPVCEGLRATLLPAGHILGAAMVRLTDGRRSVLFSGDLGRPDDPIMRAPATVTHADYLVLESTYGNRLHEAIDPDTQLADIVNATIAGGGVIVIPSFAVGRTQSLLYCIHRLKATHRIPTDLPVYLNSPMAIDATTIFRRHSGEHRLSRDQCAAMCRAARFVNTVDESMRLNTRRKPMIVIAGSGMATGGRVVHHLKAFAPDARNAIVLAGFQAGGTRGAALAAGATVIKIHGEYIPVRARVHQLGNLSAHADYGETLAWLSGFARPPLRTFIVHGEPAAADGLRLRIEERYRWACTVPDYKDVVTL